MPKCPICGKSAGVSDVHAECARLEREGKTREEIIAARTPHLAGVARDEITATAGRLVTLGAVLWILIALGSSIESVVWAASRDEAVNVFAFVGGLIIGLIVGATIYTWLKLQAQLARRLASDYPALRPPAPSLPKSAA